MRSSYVRPPTNGILESLSARAYGRLAPFLEQVAVGYGETLYQPGLKLSDVYFPLDCVISLLAVVGDGRATEVGMVGPEGMVGVPLMMGIDHAGLRAVVQGGGTAMRMDGARFRPYVKAEAGLQKILMRYTYVQMSEFALTAACNRFHNTDARLARWLLTIADRLQSTSFYFTQAFLAELLGVRRVSVTEAALLMEGRGILRYQRGNIHIRDREGLEEMACSCYAANSRIQQMRLGR